LRADGTTAAAHRYSVYLRFFDDFPPPPFLVAPVVLLEGESVGGVCFGLTVERSGISSTEAEELPPARNFEIFEESKF
jgi:hypothetical protein